MRTVRSSHVTASSPFSRCRTMEVMLAGKTIDSRRVIVWKSNNYNRIVSTFRLTRVERKRT